MRLLKIILFAFLSLCLLVVIFYFWASSHQQDKAAYFQVRKFDVPERPQKDTLSVMTYNLGYLSGMANNLPVDMPQELFETNLNRAKSILRSLAPDIIGFQEIDFRSERSQYFQQLDSLAFLGEYSMAYQSVNWDKEYVPFPYWPIKYHFGEMLSGQAILTFYEIEKSETVVLEKPINAPFYYNKFYLDRLVQISEVHIGDIEVIVMNVHLEAFDTETRQSQAKEVQRLYQRYAEQGPILLIGDFNSRPPWDGEADGVIQTILESGNIASAIGQAAYLQSPESYYTFNTDEPYQMIDYIFYNPSFIKPVESRVIHEAGQISDHLPVFMRFTFMSDNDLLITE